MAIKVGKKVEETVIHYYQGVGAFNVVAINPTKEELSNITGRTYDEDINYAGKDDNGKLTYRIAVWLKTDPISTLNSLNNCLDVFTCANFNLTLEERTGTNSGKIQIVDKYGNFAWATPAEFEQKLVPMYSTGKKATILTPYRPAFKGEEDFTNFLRTWLNTPLSHEYKNGTWTVRKDLEEAEMDINYRDIFNGNLKELKSLVELAKTYAVKACLGVKINDEGNISQRVYTKMFCKNSVTNFKKLQENILSSQASGMYQNVEFDVLPLHEYTVKETNLEQEPKKEPSENPWGTWS